MSRSKDEFVLEQALQLKLLTKEQVEEAGKLKVVFAENGVIMSLPEICVKKGWLTTDQLRTLNILLRYEDQREDDRRFGEFMVQKGFITEAQVQECLEIQREPYERGKTFPRLHELLLRKKYMTAQQLQVAYRARMQIDPKGAVHRSGTETLPAVKVPISEVPPTRPAPPPPPADKAKAREGVSIEGCRTSIRKTKIRDAQDQDLEVTVLDVEGVIDGHTFRTFDEFITKLIEKGKNRIVLNCARIDYLSSAGIGVLAGAVRHCREAKGDMRLCAVQDKIKKIIHLVGLQSLLRMYDKEEGALESFKYL